MILNSLLEADDKTIKAVYDQMEDAFHGFIVKYFQCDRAKSLEIYPQCFARLYYNIKDGKLTPPLRSSLNTYLCAIGKRLFIKNNFGNYQKKIELQDTPPDLQQADSLIDHYEYEAQKKLVSTLLSRIGEKCRALLEMIYINELDTAVICERLSLTSSGTLRKRKFDCLKKMRSLYSDMQS